MSYERWALLFILVIVILLHIALLPMRANPWLSLPGIIAAGLIVFFADFIGFIFGQIIPTMRWPTFIRMFGWAMLLLDPILLGMSWLREIVANFLYS